MQVTRRPELDALRGLMLVLMAITHVPTRYSDWLSQPFGFVSAAEGFVFLSAYMVGTVYTRRALENGTAAMRKALWRRAAVVWACQIAMLLFLFTLIANIGLRTDRQAIKNLISFYLAEPIDALWSGMAMIYNPPLLDILPMYVLFMLASPLALTLGLQRKGWLVVFVGSLTLWLLAQFGLTQEVHKLLIRAIEPKMPFHETGAFELAAWQFLWILGMWMGSRREAIPDRRAFPGWLVALSLFFAVACMIWRHVIGQAPFGPHGELNALFSKWHLGPLRVLDFVALLVVTARFGPHIAHIRFTVLETLGKASLSVFCAHIVVVLLVLAIVGDRIGQTPLWAETLLLLSTLIGLYAVALVSNRLDREERARRTAQPVSARTGG
jgi:hypothetical protein